MGGDTTTPAAGAIPDPFGLVGARLEGKYDIQSVVAEGGFGVVYRAMHRTLHKPIAVKVLKVPEALNDALRKEFLDKFAQEARTIAQFEHPAIVRVIDFGASPMPRGEAAPWMVLEWLQGATLEEDFERRRGHGRSPAEVLAMLQPIFEALAYAHDEGIAHRDIKPGNIMLVANRRGEVSARLLDFGIAKFMSQGERASGGMTATRSGLPAFSPMYAAPEQLAGSRTGPWTDVHAMALVVSEALVGAPVYPQDDNTALYAAVLSPVRPTPGAFGVQVGAWEPVLQRALSVRPDHRYGHMRAFANDLTQALGADAYAATAYPSMPYGYGPISGEMPAAPEAPEAPAPGSRSLVQTGYGDEPTAQISRAAFVQEAGASQQGGRMPLAIAPTHMASTQGAPAPSTFLPVTTQSMPSAPPPPAPSRWKPWAAVAVLALGVGAVASVAAGSRSTSPQPRSVGTAPVTPVILGAPAAPAVPVSPVETQPAALPAVVAAPSPQPVPVVRRTAPVVSPGVAAAPTAPAPPAPSTVSPVVAAPPPPPAPPPQPEPVAERPAPEPDPEPEVVAPPPPVRRAVVPARPVQPSLPSEPSPLPAPLAPPRVPRRPLHHTEIPLS